MPNLTMTFEFILEEKRKDSYSRSIEISDDPVKGAEEWVHYIESFLMEIRMAILPARGLKEVEERKVDPHPYHTLRERAKES